MKIARTTTATWRELRAGEGGICAGAQGDAEKIKGRGKHPFGNETCSGTGYACLCDGAELLVPSLQFNRGEFRQRLAAEMSVQQMIGKRFGEQDEPLAIDLVVNGNPSEYVDLIILDGNRLKWRQFNLEGQLFAKQPRSWSAWRPALFHLHQWKSLQPGWL